MSKSEGDKKGEWERSQEERGGGRDVREVGVGGAGRKAKETEGKGNGGRDEEKRKGRDRGHRSLGPLIPAG